MSERVVIVRNGFEGFLLDENSGFRIDVEFGRISGTGSHRRRYVVDDRRLGVVIGKETLLSRNLAQLRRHSHALLSVVVLDQKLQCGFVTWKKRLKLQICIFLCFGY
jgi:hypothetical protein